MTDKWRAELQDKRDYVANIVDRLRAEDHELADFFAIILVNVEQQMKEAGIEA